MHVWWCCLSSCSLPGRGPVVRDAVQFGTVLSSAPPHSALPYMSTYCTHQNTSVLPEDGQEPRPKHVGAIINKNTVPQVGANYCVRNAVARRTQYSEGLLCVWCADCAFTVTCRSYGTHETSVYIRHLLCQFPQNS